MTNLEFCALVTQANDEVFKEENEAKQIVIEYTSRRWTDMTEVGQQKFIVEIAQEFIDGIQEIGKKDNKEILDNLMQKVKNERKKSVS